MASRDHAIVLKGVDLVSPTAAATALNTVLAAEIAAAAPQPVQLIATSAIQLVGAPPPAFVYAVVALIKVQG